MATMLITVEDINKVDDVRKFAHDNNITINWEEERSDGLWIEISGDILNINKLYDIVVKINRNNSSLFTKIKNKLVKTFRE